MNALPWRSLVQPDRRSCGAAVLVVARMLRDDAYAARVAASFAVEVRATHRRVTRPWLRGRPQLPWPRLLGTPPWAVARELTAVTGERHRVRLARRPAVVGAAAPYVLYTGSRLLPRHVVLALSPAGAPLEVYDPATGGVRAGHGGWPRRWLVVSADPRRPQRPARRTPA